MIVSGSYVLNVGEISNGFLGPLRAIRKERGALLRVCAALLYSLTSSFGKIAIDHSSPVFFGLAYFIALNIIFAPIGFLMGKRDFGVFLREGKFRSVVIPGFFYSIMVLTHMTAMKFTRLHI